MYRRNGRILWVQSSETLEHRRSLWNEAYFPVLLSRKIALYGRYIRCTALFSLSIIGLRRSFPVPLGNSIQPPGRGPRHATATPSTTPAASAGTGTTHPPPTPAAPRRHVVRQRTSTTSTSALPAPAPARTNTSSRDESTRECRCRAEPPPPPSGDGRAGACLRASGVYNLLHLEPVIYSYCSEFCSSYIYR
jgi:hypothetical protein